MKTKKLIFYGVLLITTSLANLYGMKSNVTNLIIKKKIDRVNQKFDKDTVDFSYDEMHILGFFTWRRHEVAKIVLNSGELMTDTEKLDHLEGNDLFAERKKIILHMVNNKKIDPDTIIYQCYYKPLHEAVLFQDVSFATCLLEKGAKPDKQTLEKMNKSLQLAELVSKYNFQDKKIKFSDYKK